MSEATEVDINNCSFRLDEDFVPFQPLSPQANTPTPICGVGIESFALGGRLTIRNSGFVATNQEEDLYISGILLGGGEMGANTQIFIHDNEWNYTTGIQSSCIELNGEFPASTTTDIFQNFFRFDPFRFTDRNDANAIWVRYGDKNNVHIYSNTFVGDESNDFAGDPATEHRGYGIKLSGSNGENNEISDNDFPVNFFAIFNDDFSVGISSREFHHLRLCNNFVGNPRIGIWLQRADMTTEVLANTSVFLRMQVV